MLNFKFIRFLQVCLESNGSNVEVPEVKPSREIICYNVERLDPSQHALSESSEIPIFFLY